MMHLDGISTDDTLQIQWWIQDFQDGGYQPIILAILSWKLHESEKKKLTEKEAYIPSESGNGNDLHQCRYKFCKF